jgi:hypothetical protein
MRREIDLPGFARTCGVTVVLLTAALATSCTPTQATQAPTPVAEDTSVSQEISEKATVMSVDRTSRLMTLKDKDGKNWTVQVSPDVRNFDQIEVGDLVVIRYQESLAVSLVKPGEAVAPPSATLAAGRAELGEKPAVGLGALVIATVRIQSVDTKNNVVVFTRPDGQVCTVHVRRPEGQKFIAGLKPGDQVEMTYTQAVAMSVEKE